jgi:hypothetical protein
MHASSSTSNSVAVFFGLIGTLCEQVRSASGDVRGHPTIIDKHKHGSEEN